MTATDHCNSNFKKDKHSGFFNISENLRQKNSEGCIFQGLRVYLKSN